MIASPLVWTIVALEIVVPLGVAFWLGRRWERRAIGRRFSETVATITPIRPGDGFPRTRR